MSIVLAILATATGAQFADLDAIDLAVSGFAAPGIAASPVDRRLRLQPCGAPLLLSWRTSQRETVVVQCPDAGGWRLYVPIAGAGGGAVAPPLVARGDSVAISVSGDGFSVSQAGEALESGAGGDWIKVRPAGASQAAANTMRAQVVRPGLVVVQLP